MKIQADESLPEAGRRMLRLQFQLMVSHEDGTRLGDDIDAVHDMRVATRRQRAVFRIVRPYFKRKAIRAYRAGLRELAHRLGAVRDFDVMINAAEAYQASSPNGQAALEPLLTEWRAQRARAREELIAYLDGDAYRSFAQDYDTFLASPAAGTKKSATGESSEPHLVRDVAPGEIWRHYGKVRAYDAALGKASIGTLHALRIDEKRMRYLLEFFGDALGPDVAKAIEPLVALQDCIGAMHDSHVAIGLIEDFLARGRLQSLDESATQTIEGYVRDRRVGFTALRRQLKVPWRQLVRKRYRKLLARMVANL